MQGAEMKKHVREWGRGSLGKGKMFPLPRVSSSSERSREGGIMRILSEDRKGVCREKCFSGQSQGQGPKGLAVFRASRTALTPEGMVWSLQQGGGQRG